MASASFYEEKVMKKVIVIVSQILVFCMSLFAVYRLGYCNACDRYRNASECKPSRMTNFFTI